MANPYERFGTVAMPDIQPAQAVQQPEEVNPYDRFQPGGGVQTVSQEGEAPRRPEWSELPGNILSSGATNVEAAFHNPVDVGRTLGELGPSGIKKALVARYGSLENARRTVITDPVGAFMDAASVLSLGEAAGARLPGMAGAVARAGGRVGRAIDPLMGNTVSATKGVKAFGRGTAKIASGTLGMTTSAGDALNYAAKAGSESAYGGIAKPLVDRAQAGAAALPSGKLKDVAGAAVSEMSADTAPAKALKGNMKRLSSPDSISPEVLVEKARGSLRGSYKSLSDAYGKDLDAIKDISVPADQAFSTINAAFDNAAAKFRGYAPPGGRHAAMPSSATPVIDRMGKLIKGFQSKKMSPYHTVGGFDSLKRRLKDIRDAYEVGTPERSAANKIYNGVENAIDDVQPGYKKLTRDYDADKRFLNEVEQTLSLGPDSTHDSALRKMQTVMRGYTTHSNFSARSRLVQALADNGADTLFYELAGQTLRPPFKPNIAAQFTTPAMAAAIGTGYVNPAAIATLSAFSPKLMGHAAFAAGKVHGLIAKPLRAVEGALNELGISSRGVLLAAIQGGKLTDFHERTTAETKRFRRALEQQAKTMGYKLSPRVLDQITLKLLSEDKKTFIEGLHALRQNPRLLEIIREIGDDGTKGEQ